MFKISLLFISLLASFNLMAEPKVFKEKAFLRVADRTYFFSEVRELIQDFTILSCLKNQSKLWQVIEISSNELAQLSKMDKDDHIELAQAPAMTPILEKLVVIYKLKHFLNLGQRVGSFAPIANLWANNNCLGNHKISLWVEKIEQHLRSKFGEKNMMNPSANGLDLGALKDFLSSASAKYEHDYLFKK